MLPVSNLSNWVSANSGAMCPITSMSIGIVSPDLMQSFSFDKKRIKSVKFNHSGDILSGAITDYSIEIELNNSAMKINNVDYDYVMSQKQLDLMDRWHVSTAFGFSGAGEAHDNKYFVYETRCDNANETVTFIAKSVLAFMTNAYDMHRNHVVGTAYQIAVDALEQARDDDSVPKPTVYGYDYEVDDSLKDFAIRIDSEKHSIIEVLQIVANATKSIIKVNNAGKIIIQPRNTEMQLYSVSNFVQYAKPTTEIDPPIKGCELTCYGGNVTVNSSKNKGQYEEVTNMFLMYDAAYASGVAKWVSDELAENPKTYQINARFDPRIELFDVVQVQIVADSEIRRAVVTNIELQYNGAWVGDIKFRDNGDGAIYIDDNFDVYDAMMEYLASVVDGNGEYQSYTASYDDFIAYLNSKLNVLYICTDSLNIITTVDNRPLVCNG